MATPDDAIGYFIRNFGATMPACNQWAYIHSKVWEAIENSGGSPRPGIVLWSTGGTSVVEDPLRIRYPNVPCGDVIPPGNGKKGETKIWTIKGEKGMCGTVENPLATGPLWHIKCTDVADFFYGGEDAIPVTWVQSNGKDGIGVLSGGGLYLLAGSEYGAQDWYSAEELKSKVKVTFPNGKNYTGRVAISSVSMGTVAVGLALFVGAAYAILKKKKKR